MTRCRRVVKGSPALLTMETNNNKTDRIMVKQKQIEYSEVDTESLATALAERAWQEETKMQPEDELYEVVQEESGVYPYTDVPEVREVKPYWASVFFNIRESYKALINTFKKNPDIEP